MSPGPAIHATALIVGTIGVLIRGPSGAGKSRLALALIERAAARGGFAALVADDRVALTVAGGRLLARCPPTIAGLVERRGHGIVGRPYEKAAVVGLVVDLVAAEGMARMPEPAEFAARGLEVAVARQPVAAGDTAGACGLVEEALSRLSA